MTILRRVHFSLPFGSNVCYSVVFERCCSFNCSSDEGIADWKPWLNKMEGKKKRRIVTSTWRPVNLQSQSPAGHLTKEASIHIGNSSVGDQYDLEPDLGGQGSHLEDSGASEVVTQAMECPSGSVSMKPTSPSNDVQAAALKTHSQEIAITYYPRKSKNSDSEIGNNILNDLNTSRIPVTEVLQHSTSIEVDASLLRFLKGKGGITQKRIEMETGVRINIPSRENSEITVQGASVENITKAVERIKAVLDEAVKSPRLDYSHFVSLPLAIYPGLVDKLMNFQNSILGISDCESGGCKENDLNEEISEEEGDDSCTAGDTSTVSVNLTVQDDNEHVKVGVDTLHIQLNRKGGNTSSALSDLRIDKSIFIKPKTFHLTVLMLKLWNKERAATAVEVLQNVSSKVWDALEGCPISLRLTGLECMKGSPAKAGVLYAPVEVINGEDRLQRACQVIIDAYVEAGLVLEKDALRKLKLHATLMNARHRKWKKRSQKHDSFDARTIIKQYGSEDWGTYVLREAHLSQRFVFDDDGYYHRCALIPFPEVDSAVPMALEES